MILSSTLSLWGLLPFGGGIGPSEMVILGVIAVLLFGKRLPEMGRTLGKGLMEFKKGISGIEAEINSATRTTPAPRTSTPARKNFNEIDDRDESTAPKFEPPTSEPRQESSPA